MPDAAIFERADWRTIAFGWSRLNQMFESAISVGIFLLSSNTKPNTSDKESPPVELISDFSRNLRIASCSSSGYFLSIVLKIFFAQIPFISGFSVARDTLLQLPRTLLTILSTEFSIGRVSIVSMRCVWQESSEVL